MPAILKRGEGQLELDLSPLRGSGGEFEDARAKAQEVPGRYFDWDRKLWCFPDEAHVAERLIHSIQPKVASEIIEWVRSARQRESQELTTNLPDDAELQVDWAKHRVEHQPEFIMIAGEPHPFNGLMKHQRPMVDLAARVRKLVIADDMGLGKSGTSISAVEEWRIRNKFLDGTYPEGPRLIIAPNSVKGSWVRELRMWLGRDGAYQVIDHPRPEKRREQIQQAVEGHAWLIANWEQIRAKKEKQKKERRDGSVSTKMVEKMKEPLFETTDWLAVIADEVHRAKNRKSQQARGLLRCRADDGVMLALSGTPLMNSPDELWSILKWLWPKEYTSYWRFYEQYVDYYEGYFGKVITGVKNPDALRFELKDRLARRTQGQVLELPGKGRIPVDIDLNKKQRKLYDEAETALWLKVEQEIEEGSASAKKFAEAAVAGESMYRIPNGAARTTRLRQILETPANLGGEDDSAVLDRCVEMIMDSRPEQWVVFCEFKPTVECLIQRLQEKGITAEAYTGDVEPQDRSRLEDSFQAGTTDVIVGTIKAMFQGITLTAGNRQFWVSRDWTPDINEQGEDRQNRIGQDRRVMVFIAQPQNTVATDKVEPTNRLKEKIVRTVLPKDHIAIEQEDKP